MTLHDAQHFDVESSITSDLTIPSYRASRPVRRRSFLARLFGF